MSDTPAGRPSVLVRAAREADIPAVVAMIGGQAAFHGEQATISLAHLERDAFGPAPWIRLLVAEQDRQLVGYAILHPLYRAQHGHRGLELQHLYVAEASRAQGIGRALITAAVWQARALGCKYLALGTAADNKKAQAFYRRLGFEDSPLPGPRFRIVDLPAYLATAVRRAPPS